MIGLVGEKTTETEEFSEAEFLDQSIQLPNALQLGPVRVSPQGMIQMVRLEKLLTDEMKQLFQAVL
jgi:hypothetical protein